MARDKSSSNGNGANLGFEAKLWLTADKLRNNMDAAEYKHVVLGLIFLKYISDSFEEMRAKLVACKATTMGHIQRGHLTAAKVLVPPPDLLKAMTRIMTPFIEQIVANRTQSRTLGTLRDTLLPKLLRGELTT
jgi:hypothetical protein